MGVGVVTTYAYEYFLAPACVCAQRLGKKKAVSMELIGRPEGIVTGFFFLVLAPNGRKRCFLQHMQSRRRFHCCPPGDGYDSIHSGSRPVDRMVRPTRVARWALSWTCFFLRVCTVHVQF